MTRRCWFCQEEITGLAERHHRIPKRTFRRGEDHRRNNIVWSHPDCHRSWHRYFDNPSIRHRQQYLDRFGPSLGEGVFAR